ncbi:MAG TPA: hypothetical protein VEJ63_14845 [Planctomycetota bacterium]|nr:hypothetical protein [Planctomycetota bacterium]
MEWSDSKGLNLDESLRERARTGLRAVADWASRNQGRHRWPRWSADTGRFPYHVHLKTDDTFRSTSWNTARMVQGLLSAWLVFREPEYLYAAECGLEYVKSIQFFGPEAPETNGLFLGETPLSDHSGFRDSIECAQALMAHHLITRDPVSLIRTKAFLDVYCNKVSSAEWNKQSYNLVPRLKPMQFLQGTGPERSVISHWCEFAAPLVLLQAAVVTNNPRYTEVSEQFGGYILEHICHADGSLRAKNSGHHTSSLNGELDNDDGLVLALIALWKHTQRKKYLDAAVANGEWWIKRGDKMPANFTTRSVLVMIMADLARATGDAKYNRWLHQHAAAFFDLQILRDSRPLVSGAFLGEDMAENYRKGSAPGDYISLRSTSYGALALGRLACGAAREWNPSYSAFGW